MIYRALIVPLTAVAVLAAGRPALAQSGQTAQIPLQFDFLNPGARSLGLGSAFTAVADDATAAFTNPAGLTFLIRPEVSAELRFRRLSTSFLSGGRLSGTPTNQGIDTTSGPLYGQSIDSAFRPYFLSVVYPHGRWAFSGYRHELVLQDNSFLSQGPFLQTQVDTTVVNASRLSGLTGSRTITVDNYGAAAGYRVSSHLSLGVGLSIYHFDDTSSFASLPVNLANFFLALDPSTAGTSSTTTQTGSSTSVAVNVGAIASVNPKLRVGAVYRQGASFDFTQVNKAPGLATVNESGKFRDPDVLGVGVRILPDDQFSISIDYDRVRYSRLVEDFIAFQADASFVSRLSIPDGNEIHVGVEYTVTSMKHSPSFRGGVWFDPDHTVNYQSNGTNSSDDVRLKATFPVNAGVWHYCFGFGMPVSRAFEFNVGADLASERRYVSGSIVARFGK